MAYHGCDVTTRDDLVSGSLKSLNLSENNYDWLGNGVYFYEADSTRALKYAKTSAKNLSQLLTAQAIGTPAVVGAILDVERWLDITTQFGISQFTEGLESLKANIEAAGVNMPTNKPAFEGDQDSLHRALDRAVFENVHAMRKGKLLEALAADQVDIDLVLGCAEFQAVRGAFQQGGAIANGSAIHGDSHIQIALREPKCVLGWFLVPGDKLLSKEEYEEAKSALAAAKRAKTNLKRRVKATVN